MRKEEQRQTVVTIGGEDLDPIRSIEAEEEDLAREPQASHRGLYTYRSAHSALL